jgi:hypothetical protein
MANPNTMNDPRLMSNFIDFEDTYRSTNSKDTLVLPTAAVNEVNMNERIEVNLPGNRSNFRCRRGGYHLRTEGFVGGMAMAKPLMSYCDNDKIDDHYFFEN